MSNDYNSHELPASNGGNSEILPDNGPVPNSDENQNDDFLPNRPGKKRNWILIAIIALLLLNNFDLTGELSMFWGKSVNIEENINDCSHLFLKAKNGSIKAKGYNGEKIKLTVRYSKSFFGGNVDFKLRKNGKEARLDYDGKVSGLSIEASIPYDQFSSMTLQSSNGTIETKDLNILNTHIKTSNGSVSVDQWTGEKLTIETSNGRVNLTDVLGDEAEIKTSNGAIDFKAKEFVKDKEYDYSFKTSNGSIHLDLPKDNQIAYKIKAKTSNATIHHNLDHFIGEDDSDSRELSGRTSNYDEAATKVNIEMKTSNASITID